MGSMKMMKRGLLMQRFKLLFLALTIGCGSVGGGLASTAAVAAAPAYFAASVSQGAACSGLSQLDPAQACGGNNGQTAVTKIVKVVVNVLSLILGIAGVIMVVISGFRYITSGGDSGAVTSAKRTLIYALVGLALAAAAHFLVDFTIHQTNQATGGS